MLFLFPPCDFLARSIGIGELTHYHQQHAHHAGTTRALPPSSTSTRTSTSASLLSSLLLLHHTPPHPTPPMTTMPLAGAALFLTIGAIIAFLALLGGLAQRAHLKRRDARAAALRNRAWPQSAVELASWQRTLRRPRQNPGESVSVHYSWDGEVRGAA